MKKLLQIISYVLFVFAIGHCQELSITVENKNSTEKRKSTIKESRDYNIAIEYPKDYTLLMAKLIPRLSSSELVQKIISSQRKVELLATIDAKNVVSKFQLDTKTAHSLNKLISVSKARQNINNQSIAKVDNNNKLANHF